MCQLVGKSAPNGDSEQHSADQRETDGRAGRDEGDATEESVWLTRSLALCHLGAVGGLGHLAHDAAVCGGSAGRIAVN